MLLNDQLPNSCIISVASDHVGFVKLMSYQHRLKNITSTETFAAFECYWRAFSLKFLCLC